MAPSSPPAWLDRWVGLPFEHRGRGPAYDCWGFARALCAAVWGIALPEKDAYESTRDRALVAGVVAAARPDFLQVEEPRAGDLVLLRIAGARCHVGVVVAMPWFAHCAAGVGSRCERLDAPAWSNRVEGFFRWTR